MDQRTVRFFARQPHAHGATRRRVAPEAQSGAIFEVEHAGRSRERGEWTERDAETAELEQARSVELVRQRRVEIGLGEQPGRRTPVAFERDLDRFLDEQREVTPVDRLRSRNGNGQEAVCRVLLDDSSKIGRGDEPDAPFCRGNDGYQGALGLQTRRLEHLRKRSRGNHAPETRRPSLAGLVFSAIREVVLPDETLAGGPFGR